FIHHHCGAPNGDYGVAYRCRSERRVGIEPGIRPGQEDTVARMLGRGELLQSSCRLVEGRIEPNFVHATYACGASNVTLQLIHPSRAREDALRTKYFAVVVAEGSPPAGFRDAIAERVRSHEAAFHWSLEPPPDPTSGIEPGAPHRNDA